MRAHQRLQIPSSTISTAIAKKRAAGPHLLTVTSNERDVINEFHLHPVIIWCFPDRVRFSTTKAITTSTTP
ncbi:uncharacterized protein PHALS_05233 [Plasmopara halstedii]|uniref:Uncharacterized protein n=1 Tax=Plasmopara halstedii TaxID=4781 RepID=A0A0P1B151_PLAHL|nr:uncharacterized protein PHALS_05233 [Plasmopara halstedii]CEG47909.1 hypothetical protein PHALS_05233 [Plasmopara halstedii]|eukprot:XP_024584278.1 hypothetical protein PHALS_05233 [Plasmopara halstedii]